jgi:hypothetical protein
MTKIEVELVLMCFAFVVGLALMVVAAVKTVRYHGWGQQKMAPPAVPWFVASMLVAVAILAYAFFAWGH